MAGDRSSEKKTEPIDGSFSNDPGTIGWLVGIVRRLLAPGGCPWDREQSLETLRPYLLEECYEVLDAIDSGDRRAHAEELGDLLLQIVFQSQLAGIELVEVITAIGEKLIRRHPHVFGEAQVRDADEVTVNWDRIKAREKPARAASPLASVSRTLPALHRCHELTQRAARAGFAWPDALQARAKVDEELAEADEAAAGADPAATRREVGDLLFAVGAWARQLGVQPEDALQGANGRFERRFARLARELADEGRTLEGCSAGELLARWRATASG